MQIARNPSNRGIVVSIPCRSKGPRPYAGKPNTVGIPRPACSSRIACTHGSPYTRSTRLIGILNGVDYDEWSPQADRLYPGTDRCRRCGPRRRAARRRPSPPPRRAGTRARPSAAEPVTRHLDVSRRERHAKRRVPTCLPCVGSWRWVPCCRQVAVPAFAWTGWGGTGRFRMGGLLSAISTRYRQGGVSLRVSEIANAASSPVHAANKYL